MCLTSIWSCKYNITEVYVASCRQHVDSVLSALHIWSANDCIVIQVKDLLHNIISIVIIISVLRSLLSYEAIDIVVSFKVVLHSFDELVHSEVLLIKYIVLNRC